MNIHPCDTCREYKNCYEFIPYADEEFFRREIEIGGCPMWKELCVKDMFMSNTKERALRK